MKRAIYGPQECSPEELERLVFVKFDNGATKAKRGRPSRGKRRNFTFRLTDKLRDELLAISAISKRSISEEIEMILEKVLFPISMK